MTTATPLSPPSVELDGLPRLIPFKFPRTEDQVFTHRSYFARPTAVFEDPPNDPAPDNEVLEYVGDSVLSLAVATLTKKTYPGLRVGPHAKIRSLVVQNVTIARISEHYGLSKRLVANQSQLASLQRSVYVQADLFEAYIGGLYDDWGWEYVKPWLFKVLLPYIQEAHRIVQGSYYQSRDHDRGPSDLGGGIDPRSPPSRPADGPSSGTRRQDALGIFHSPHLGGPSQGGSPLVPTSSPGGAFSSSLISEGHLSLLNQILQHARKNMDWDFIMDPSSPTTTPVWDAKGKLNNVIIAEGRGNTKKLAKNDGAKTLVTDLQDELTAAKHVQTIPNLAKQLALHLKQVKEHRDKVEEATMVRQYEEDEHDALPLYQPQQPPYHQASTGKGKVADRWNSGSGQQRYSPAHHYSMYSPPRPGG